MEAARRAEEAGYDDVWVCDHLEGIPRPEVPVHEGWTILAAVAAVTGRIGLGTLVLATMFRAPRVLAKAAATLAEVAPGRLTLGLGAGWNRDEHAAFAVPYPPYVERVARLEETVDALRELAPGVPVLLGGAGDLLIDLAARKGDLWNAPTARLPALPALAARLRRKAAQAGRRVEVVARLGSGPYGFVGDDADVLAQVEWCRSLGVERLVLRFHPRDAQALERFAAGPLARWREGGLASYTP